MNPHARAIMVQGTASNVGKSWLATGLCRLLRRAGVRVAPFKAVNMANNAFATRAGGEIGWAQAAQAEAAGLEPTVDMNPILLKPTSESGSQVIIHGRVQRTMAADEFRLFRAEAMAAIEESYARLARAFAVVVIEGAGSPAEINLRERDLANMRMARVADAAVLLVADASGAGAVASLVGTLALLTPDERGCLLGCILNKCPAPARAHAELADALRRRTGVALLGAVPLAPDLWIPGEDSVVLDAEGGRGEAAAGEVRVAVLQAPWISNFMDVDPLRLEPGVTLRYVREPDGIAGADVVILPGSKNTIGDLAFLRDRGFVAALARTRRFGAMIVGLCGGYQMLGRWVEDAHGMEGPPGRAPGLALLDVTTVLAREKATHQVVGVVEPGSRMARGAPVEGYEIHLGQTARAANVRPLLVLRGRDGHGPGTLDGAMSADGAVWGTYVHGIFDAPGFRRAVVDAARKRKGLPPIGAPPGPTAREFKAAQYDRLADLLAAHLDLRPIERSLGVFLGRGGGGGVRSRQRGSGQEQASSGA